MRFGAVPLIVALLGSSAQAPPVPAGRVAVVDRSELLGDLRTLSADDMQGREVGSPGGAKARAFIVERFRAVGIEPIGGEYTRPFTFSVAPGRPQQTGVNVVGRIVGTRQTPRAIVVSAHYDHVGVKNGQVFNGADDNASGTAALFAMAKYFSRYRPANTLIFAAFDGEEVGLRGAIAFVKSPPVNVTTLVLDINVDMIGRDPNDKLFVVGTSVHPVLKPYIERVAAKASVKLLMGYDDPKDRDNWLQDSDHYAFIQAKIPALLFSVEDYAQHHKATDDYETMTYDFYVHAVETVIAVIQEFDANLDAIAQASR